MKRYIRVEASSKQDTFREATHQPYLDEATDQRYLNEIYMSLDSLIDALNGLSTDKFNEIGLDRFYKIVFDRHQDMYKYYKP